MSVTSIQRNFNNQPQIVNMSVTETQAAVAATGWLGLASTIASIELANNGLWVWQPGDLVLVYSSTDDTDVLFQVDLVTNSFILYSTAGNGAVTLPVVDGDFTVFDGTLGALKDAGFSPSDPAKTKVVMAGSATQVGYIAHFVDTAGTVDDTAGTVQNDGSIQAGKSGVAGTLISFPTTAANGSLIISALNAGGAFNTTIRNSVMGQSSVISIPDPGAATAKFILDTLSSQTITGNLVVTGSLQSNAGNITSGSSGDAGTFISFPATAANGTLILAAVNAGGAFNTTISNSSMGQSSVISIPDPGVATSKFVLTDSASTQTIATGNLAFTLGYSQVSAVNALTAHAGGGQALGTPLTRQINRVTTVASAGDSVLLPAAVAGRWVTVINAAAANAMDVFPASGEIINALAANTALSVVADTSAVFYCAVNGTWNSVVTA